MSIPPLVCSTPPPPEQCEDDKDPEDFDLSYNLSQEEDDDSTEYNFGNYSSYNIYAPKLDTTDTAKWPSHFDQTVECKQEDNIQDDGKIRNDNFIVSDDLYNEDIPKFEENVLEDLNLKIEADEIHSIEKCGKENETETDIYSKEESSESNTGIQDQGGTDILRNEENITLEDVPVVIENITSNDIDQVCNEKNEDIQNIYNDLTATYESKLSEVSSNSEQTAFPSSVISEVEKPSETVNEVQDQTQHLSDDEFGDFEDFQFKNSSSNDVMPISSENPWDNEIESDTTEFSAFTANFESNVEVVDKTSNTAADNNSNSVTNEDDHDDDDDFGDFDDFKSSNNISEDTEEAKNITATSNVPVLNFHSQENELQIIDSINNVLTSIFANEISELDNSLDEKLEQYLSETWGHLVDTDIRQPYMVNWNNSLGQKTLLKALCIDSRNILFGHKWNSSMPKYAANLSTAPLQPQKQQTQSVPPQSESIEKPANKETGAWVDPFTPDGQDYTYAEALLLDLEHLMATLDQMAHKHSTLNISELLSHACNKETESAKEEVVKRPTDLDVFESEASTKINKIYSSTINVQPLRHINLPDTHIFTPTDSETPRSKTIHYDDVPTLVPAPVVPTDKSEPEQSVHQSINMESESEYWEFQDFKGSTEVSPPKVASQDITPVQQTATIPTAEPPINPGVTYETQILQPIKIEPIIPTLNWPDPGEVKETFDDFSDFISSTSWSNEIENNAVELKQEAKNVEENKTIKTEKIDDEFETFQSAPAPPPLSVPPPVPITAPVPTRAAGVIDFDFNASQNKVPEISIPKITEKNKTETTNFKKSNDIPIDIPNMAVQNNMLGLQDFNYSQSSVMSPSNYHVNSILQPTSSNVSTTARTQHNAGQILQPLSLESYSQINWPNPGIDLQDLSRFNPVNSLHSLKSDTVTGGNSKNASPSHNSVHVQNEISDDDIWGDFVSSMPKQQTSPKKPVTFADDDEWTDFVSSPSIRPQNGLNTISLNVHTNLSMQKSSNQKMSTRNSQMPLDIPTLNYITPKSNNRGIYTEKHFQNL